MNREFVSANPLKLSAGGDDVAGAFVLIIPLGRLLEAVESHQEAQRMLFPRVQ
jgi:hypothetical protein